MSCCRSIDISCVYDLFINLATPTHIHAGIVEIKFHYPYTDLRKVKHIKKRRTTANRRRTCGSQCQGIFHARTCTSPLFTLARAVSTQVEIAVSMIFTFPLTGGIIKEDHACYPKQKHTFFAFVEFQNGYNVM